MTVFTEPKNVGAEVRVTYKIDSLTNGTQTYELGKEGWYPSDYYSVHVYVLPPEECRLTWATVTEGAVDVELLTWVDLRV